MYTANIRWNSVSFWNWSLKLYFSIFIGIKLFSAYPSFSSLPPFPLLLLSLFRSLSSGDNALGNTSFVAIRTCYVYKKLIYFDQWLLITILIAVWNLDTTIKYEISWYRRHGKAMHSISMIGMDGPVCNIISNKFQSRSVITDISSSLPRFRSSSNVL